jgi:hypothetical protein
MNVTSEAIKSLLSTPVALFVIMLLASLGSAWKQMLVARRSGTEISVSSYFLKNWPETVAMLGHNAIAFVTLIFTDQLGWAAAIGLGYIANDAADAYTKEGRSVSMGTPRQGGYARVAMLVFVVAIAALVLQACTTTPVDVIKTACTPGTTYTAERCAKGVGETYEVYQARAAEIVANPSTPADVKEAVRAAESLASAVVIETLKAGAFYAEVKAQLATGQTTEEKVAVANANLEAWVAKAIPLIRSFGDALGR